MATVTQKGTSVTPYVVNAYIQGGPAVVFPPHVDKKFMGIAGESIASGDACYFKTSDGLVYKVPTTLNTPFHGLALEQARTGDPVTLGHNCVFDYCATAQNINAPLYLSGTTAGKLDAAAASNGAPVAYIVPKPGSATSITTSSYIYVLSPILTPAGTGAGAVVNAYTQTYSTANRTVAAATAVALTDSSGGSANATYQTGPTLTSATLTDNSAGTANTTVQAIPDPTDAPATADDLREDLVAVHWPAIRNNFADLAAQVNALRVDLAALITVVNNNFADTAVPINALILDDLDNRQTISALIDDLQANGLAS